ncbi:MAG: glycerophosphodiester phosphodiesterase family protein [Parabacteroides merdae]
MASDKEQNPHYITVKNSRDLQAYFRYAPDRPIVISGHRGGMLDGYPENCIESFEKTLSYMESFFEIDPRLTKDGIIVLIHDETIDRTTNWERKGFRLHLCRTATIQSGGPKRQRDSLQNSNFKRMPEWSKGKTILNLDIKDVPLEVMADFIETEKLC